MVDFGSYWGLCGSDFAVMRGHLLTLTFPYISSCYLKTNTSDDTTWSFILFKVHSNLMSQGWDLRGLSVASPDLGCLTPLCSACSWRAREADDCFSAASDVVADQSGFASCSFFQLNLVSWLFLSFCFSSIASVHVRTLSLSLCLSLSQSLTLSLTHTGARTSVVLYQQAYSILIGRTVWFLRKLLKLLIHYF